MQIALSQFNPTVGDFPGNSARILSFAEKAKERGADLAVFSEMCVCGYLPQDLLERPAFIERNEIAVREIAVKASLPVVVGYAVWVIRGTGKMIANRAALLC